jgi:ketosteroid isomerase-like protein
MTLTPAASTETVLGHHLQCFRAGDLEGILSDYAPDAVLCTPSGVVRGPDAMAGLFRAFFAEFAKPGATFTVQRQSIEGEVAHIVWAAETADNVYDLGTDTFVVRDGKIIAQPFAAKTTPKG